MINMQSFVQQIRITRRGDAFSNENETEGEEKGKNKHLSGYFGVEMV